MQGTQRRPETFVFLKKKCYDYFVCICRAFVYIQVCERLHATAHMQEEHLHWCSLSISVVPGSDSGHQAWWQVLLPAKSSHQL